MRPSPKTEHKHMIAMLCKMNLRTVKWAQCDKTQFRTAHLSVLMTVSKATRNTFCGTWYLPHSQIHNDQTVPIKCQSDSAMNYCCENAMNRQTFCQLHTFMRCCVQRECTVPLSL